MLRDGTRITRKARIKADLVAALRLLLMPYHLLLIWSLRSCFVARREGEKKEDSLRSTSLRRRYDCGNLQQVSAVLKNQLQTNRMVLLASRPAEDLGERGCLGMERGGGDATNLQLDTRCPIMSQFLFCHTSNHRVKQLGCFRYTWLFP